MEIPRPHFGVRRMAYGSPCRRRGRSRAAAATSRSASCSGSWTVIFRSLPVRMAARNLSFTAIDTKQPILVQVWIGWRSGGAAVDPDLDRFGQVEAERKLDGHLRRRLGIGGPAHQHRHQQPVALVGNALEQLLHRAAIQDLAVAGAFDAPCRDILGICRADIARCRSPPAAPATSGVGSSACHAPVAWPA